MWEGGVATWKRSSGPRPRTERQCSVAWPMESCVWRTAFGSPVVPELKTRMASAVPPGASESGRSRLCAKGSFAVSSRSVTPPAPSDRARSAAASASATACTGPVSSSACPTSVDFHAGLRSTEAAPSLLTA